MPKKIKQKTLGRKYPWSHKHLIKNKKKEKENYFSIWLELTNLKKTWTLAHFT